MAKSERKLSSVERAIARQIGDGRKLGRDDDPAVERFPELWEWLTRIFVSRTEMKTPATLTLRAAPEGFMASLSDRDLQIGLDVPCANLEEVFATLERYLTDPNTTFKSYGRKEPLLRKRRTAQ